jgi:hypothetical protein
MSWPRKFSAQYFRAHSRDDNFPLIPEGVTELRVHGVSGAPPETLLNDPHPQLVSGDDTAAFYRRVLGPETATDASFPSRAVEAYSWSGLNSRRSSRALWILLFPFGMANFAGWLVGPGRSQSLQRALIRTTGLVFTLHYVITAMVLSVDLLAFQCARAPQCLELQWLGPLRIAHRILDPTRPIRMLVAFGLLPIAFLIALLVIGKRNPHEYEERKFNEMEGVPRGLDNSQEDIKVDNIPLSNARFWRAPDVVDIQALLHAAAGLAFVGAVLALSIRLTLKEADQNAFLYVGLAQLLVVGTAVAEVLRAGWQLEWGKNYSNWRWRARCLIGAATLLDLVVAKLAWSREITDEASRAATLNGIWQALGIVIAVEFLLVVMMLANAYWRLALAIVFTGVGLFQAFLPFKDQQPVIAIATAPSEIEATVKKLGTIIVFLGGWAHPLRWKWQFWVLVEILLAALWCAIYLWRRKHRDDPKSPNPDNHLHNFFWIFAGLVAIVLAAVPSARSVTERDPNPWDVSPIPIPVWIGPVVCSLVIALAYLLVMFKIQLTRGHDYPPRWQLRGGGPGTVLAVGAIGITMMSAAFIIFSAQGLGYDLPLRDKFLADSMPADFNAGNEDCECRADDQEPPETPPFDPSFGEQSTEAERLDPKFGGPLSEARIWYHDELGWIASSGLAALLIFLLAAVGRILALGRFRFNGSLREAIAKKLTRDLTDQSVQWSPERIQDLAKKRASARKWASLVDDADWLLSVGAAALVACLLSVGIAQLANRELGALDNIARIAAASLVLLAGASVYLVRSSYRQGNIRKTVGVLWDVTSFFPRRYHALAPPCYAERAVPELRDRLVLLTRPREGTRPEGKVLLLAHSQGSLLSFAVLRTFENKECFDLLHRIWFVSYGSMLQRLFGRAYGAVVQGEGLVTLKNYLEGYPVENVSKANQPPRDAKGQDLQFPSPKKPPSRWQNFARNTDYLGGRLFASQFRYQSPEIEPEKRDDDILFDDPPRPMREPGETNEAPFWRHSFDYLDDEEDPGFEKHVVEVLHAMNLNNPGFDGDSGLPPV